MFERDVYQSVIGGVHKYSALNYLTVVHCIVVVVNDIADCLMVGVVGLDDDFAAILFMVARRTIWQAVMVGGGLYFVWRMLKAKNTVAQIAALVGGFKMSLAVLFAVKVSGVVGLWLGSNFQVCNEPLACLHGWRIFQLAYLMSLVGVMPGLMALADIAQGKLLSARTRGQGVLVIGIFITLCLGLYVINPVDLSPHQAGRYQEDDHEDDEGEESESSHLDGYRLTEDEPWEIRS